MLYCWVQGTNVAEVESVLNVKASGSSKILYLLDRKMRVFLKFGS